MKSIAWVVVAAGVLVGAFASPASGAVTSSNVASPATNTVFANPDLTEGAPPETLTVSGTSNGTTGDSVDIFCVYGSPLDSATGSDPLATLSTSAGGNFSGSVNLADFAFYICKLIAVPHNQGFNAAGTYTGPVISDAGHENIFTLGKQTNLWQSSSQSGGYWDVYSAGYCLVNSSYPVNAAANLNYVDSFWGCTKIVQNGTTDPLDLTIDGTPALLPYKQDAGSPAMQGIQGVQTSVDATGHLHVSESETPLICTGPSSDCTVQSPSGMRLDSNVTGSGNGSTLRVENTWVNTGAAERQLSVSYLISTWDTSPGFRMPGEASFTSHTPGSTFPPPAGVASAAAIENPGGSCGSVLAPCGSVTWSQPPSSITFGANDEPILAYERTVPPGCGAHFEFAYSQGINLTAVNALAAANESALAGLPSVTCPPPGPTSVPAPSVVGKPRKCKKKAKRATAAKKRKCRRKRR